MALDTFAGFLSLAIIQFTMMALYGGVEVLLRGWESLYSNTMNFYIILMCSCATMMHSVACASNIGAISPAWITTLLYYPTLSVGEIAFMVFLYRRTIFMVKETRWDYVVRYTIVVASLLAFVQAFYFLAGLTGNRSLGRAFQFIIGATGLLAVGLDLLYVYLLLSFQSQTQNPKKSQIIIVRFTLVTTLLSILTVITYGIAITTSINDMVFVSAVFLMLVPLSMVFLKLVLNSQDTEAITTMMNKRGFTASRTGRAIETTASVIAGEGVIKSIAVPNDADY
ncbi:hypothetical protein MP228_007695 [Amoeboaphelidium protococcarum]|nr:hypothetical protein MP228_007695 [Amoeboaphelidium protococcarum]